MSTEPINGFPALLQAHRTEIMALAAQYGASNIRIFGSVARGEARPGSDIDILVDLEPGRSLLDLGGLLMDLRDLLQVPVDVGTATMLKERIRERVLAEAIPL
jgi:predicted nucleotidyltransferase